MAESVNNRHGNGLVLILLALSILAIVWLFTPFIAYLFLSLLICISTFGSFSKLSQKRSKKERGALGLAAASRRGGQTLSFMHLFCDVARKLQLQSEIGCSCSASVFMAGSAGVTPVAHNRTCIPKSYL